MCFAVTCTTCGKTTWSGCGAHIESALRNVPMENRCAGWKTGRCVPVQKKTQYHCESCGDVMEANSELDLARMVDSHECN